MRKTEVYSATRQGIAEMNEDLHDLRDDFHNLKDYLEVYQHSVINRFFEAADAEYNKHLKPMCLMAKYVNASIKAHLDQIDRTVKELEPISKGRRKAFLILDEDKAAFLHERRLLLRVLRQTCGSLLTSSRWQAHAVVREETRFDPDTGLDQINDRSPWPFNYSRWYSRLIEDYEANFCRAFYPDYGVRALLTSSGMSAISLAFDIISRMEGDEPLALFYFKGLVYDEASRIIHTFRKISSKIETFDLEATNYDALEHYLSDYLNRTHGNVIFYFDVISPFPEQRVINIVKVLEMANKVCPPKCYIVIDKTRTGPLCPLRDILRSSVINISIYEIESLAQYHLYGGDYVDAGFLVVVDMLYASFYDKYQQQEGEKGLLSLRANNGQIFPESLVRSLPAPDASRFRRRLNRLSRNAGILANALKNGCVASRQIRVSYLGLPDHPSYELAQSISFDGSLLFIQHHNVTNKMFMTLMRHRLQENGLTIPQRGSYGFDYTSLDLFGDASQGWVRISAGSENLDDIHRLAAGLVEAVNSLDV